MLGVRKKRGRRGRRRRDEEGRRDEGWKGKTTNSRDGKGCEWVREKGKREKSDRRDWRLKNESRSVLDWRILAMRRQT